MLTSTSYSRLDHKPVISLIIPTYNEAKNLPLVLPYIPLDVVDEVILVDGRSSDHTVEIATRLMPSIKVVFETKRGKGAALQRGYSESTGDILVVLDADGSNDPREIPRFIRVLLEGADLVKGTRFAPSGGTTDMPRFRKIGNWGLTQMVNWLFSQRFTDLNYGYHAFWRHCLDYINVHNINGFEIDTSIYLQAVRNSLKVVEVPSFEGFRFYGEGKLKTFPDGWRVLRTILKEWGTYVHTVRREPSVGFRSYGSFKSNPFSVGIPVTGNTSIERPDGASTEGQPGRKRITLKDFFNCYIQNVPGAELDPLVSNVLIYTMERFGASSGSLVILNDDPDQCKNIRVFGRTIEFIPTQQMIDVLQKGITGWAIQNRQPVLVTSTATDSRWLTRQWERDQGASRSALAFPFIHQNKVVGVFVMSRPDDRQFTETDLNRVENFEFYL